MVNTSLRESDPINHHITGEGVSEVLATAGLLAEAINFRNGFNSMGGESKGKKLSLSMVSEGFDGMFIVDEYLIREVGHFWLISNDGKVI